MERVFKLSNMMSNCCHLCKPKLRNLGYWMNVFSIQNFLHETCFTLILFIFYFILCIWFYYKNIIYSNDFPCYTVTSYNYSIASSKYPFCCISPNYECQLIGNFCGSVTTGPVLCVILQHVSMISGNAYITNHILLKGLD